MAFINCANNLYTPEEVPGRGIQLPYRTVRFFKQKSFPKPKFLQRQAHVIYQSFQEHALHMRW